MHNSRRTPGGRSGGITCPVGTLWLFGGDGHDSAGESGRSTISGVTNLEALVALGPAPFLGFAMDTN